MLAHRLALTTAVAALCVCWCPQAYAPIYSFYPGLPSLIAQSDVIAAVTIVKQVKEDVWYLGGEALYTIQFDKVFKGAPPKKQVVVLLRELEITPEAEAESTPSPQPPPAKHIFESYGPYGTFQPHSRKVMFLCKTTDKDATYENVNCEGSIFPISPLRDLDSLKKQPLEETLTFLFRDYVEFRRAELRDLEKQLDTFVHGNG